MNLVKRGAVAIALAASSTALFTGSASATMTYPYSTSSGTGSISVGIGGVGSGICLLSNVAVRTLSSTSGVITGFTVSGCTVPISGGDFYSNIGITTDLASRTVQSTISVLISNILGGRCAYAGTLAGRASGTSLIAVDGTVPLTRTLSGVCASSGSVALNVTLPGATIS